VNFRRSGAKVWPQVKITFSPLAKDDLTEIAVFIAHDNPARATTFVDALEEKCQLLGVSPGIGTSRPELGAGLTMTS
jgi:toxin ParE1/3/4